MGKELTRKQKELREELLKHDVTKEQIGKMESGEESSIVYATIHNREARIILRKAESGQATKEELEHLNTHIEAARYFGSLPTGTLKMYEKNIQTETEELTEAYESLKSKKKR